MEVYRRSSWLLLLLGVSLLAATLQGVQGEAESEGPSESECRPYIEKALKELETGDTAAGTDSKEDVPTIEITTDDSEHGDDDTPDDSKADDEDDDGQADSKSAETTDQSIEDAQEATSAERTDTEQSQESKPDTGESQEDDVPSVEEQKAEDADEQKSDEAQDTDEEQNTEAEQKDEPQESVEERKEGSTEEQNETKENVEEESAKQESAEEAQEIPSNEAKESAEDTKEDSTEVDAKESVEDTEEAEGSPEEAKESAEDTKEESAEPKTKESVEETEDTKESVEDTKESDEQKESEEDKKDGSSEDTAEDATKETESTEDAEGTKEDTEESKEEKAEESDEESKEESASPVEELSLDTEIPTNLRPRDFVEHLLKLDEDSSEVEQIIDRVSEITLRELKKLYEHAIKPLETLYKYRDLSNRHFGDAEIYSKPLILFMGPWSGGKSSIINYLIDNEYNETSLRTGAEPSPAYFNILMYGEEPEVLDGTQLVSDFTFSGLQKFGQGLEERLRGYKLPSKLLEKVNIVEIPGILEVRKQVSRVFPFNDACQWFIDRADIIFLVYDPSKLDVGPETEAILDQLKGREHQTRIILNKADQVKPEELMRVQGALIWNISPLMSSPQPPVMYTTSLWSRPYETWAPVRLLQAQERAFLRDLRTAIDKRIDNKIASARRFAVRVRNHAKMVDCYLTTYYNHKSVFGNRKQVADEIIEHPQDYHIYEGLSTLTNISRYDLPDPEVYKDFFKLNALYEFQQLSATCTYFRGCPINRLDVAIAYDLPELIGKHRRLVEAAVAEANPGS